MHKFSLAIIIVSACFAQFSLFSETDENSSGRTAMPMLKFSGDARNASLGGFGTSILAGSEAISANPARLTALNRSDFRFTHTELGIGMRLEKASFSYPTFDFGAFALQWTSFRSGSIADARNIDEEPVSVTTADISIGGAYALSFRDGLLSAGLHAQYIESRLASTVARGFSMDASLNINPTQSISISAVVKNGGAKLKYLEDKTPLPLGFTGDMAIHMFDKRATITCGAAKYADEALKIGGGIEASMHPAFKLRAGYLWNNREKLAGESAADGLRFGTGVAIGDFTINYAYTKTSAFFGTTHLLEAIIGFSPIIPPTADDYLRKAQRQFREGRYERCILSAEDALKRNPNLWQAYALIEEARRMINVREGNLVTIFYTGNTNGIFVPSIENGLGGLARRSGLLKVLRNDYPYSVSVDGGNLINSGTDSALWETGYQLLKRMDYGAINIGQNESDKPLHSIIKIAEKNSVPILSSTLASTNKKVIGRIVHPCGGGYSAAIFGASPLKAKSGIDPASLLRPLINPVKDEVNLVILLFSGTMEQAKVIARALQSIDAIVCGAERAPSYKPLTEGRTLIVSPGKDGSYLGALTFQFGKDKKITGYRNKVFPLDASTPEDESVSRALKALSAQGEIEPVDTLFDRNDTWLPFVSRYDFTTYHGRKLDSAQIDSVVWLKLGRNADPLDPAFDSTRQAIKSADSIKIAAELKRGGLRGVADPSDTTFQIYLMSLGSGKKKRISFNRRQNRMPAINYQNSGVLFFADSVKRSRSITNLYIFLPEYNLTRKMETDENALPLAAAWSAEGDAVYVVEKDITGKSEIFLQTIKGKGRVNISRSKDASEYAIAVAPNGRNIAYTSDRELGRPLYISDPYGEKPVRIMDGHSYCSNPAFSGSGRYLAFTANSSRNAEFGDLLIHDTRTGQLDTLIAGQPVHEINWYGDNMLFAVQGETYSDIVRIDIKERTFTRHTERSKKGTISERNPTAFMVGDTLKVFFEQVSDDKKEVYWTESPSNRPIKFYNQADVIRLR